MNVTRKARRLLPILALFLFCIAAGAESSVLVVTGEVTAPLHLTMAELRAMPAIKVKATDHDNRLVEYEGVSLHEILQKAEVAQGEGLRGGALQLCLVVKAVFSLAELDPLFNGKQVILAYRRDGADLEAKSGPLRLVIPGEKRQARWVRQVTELDIVRVGKDGKP